MKKVAFHNLGCKVNSYELDGISQMFQNRGYEIVDFAQKADVYIVNTCTVTNIADRKSRQMLSRARRQNPDAIVVAAGCYVQNDPEGAAANASVDIVVGNNHKSQIVDIVEDHMAGRNKDHIIVSDLKEPCEYEKLSISQTNGHTRAFMKIQDGCDQFCSYCAIPFARGRARSRDIDDITKEAADLARNGYREIVITGIHLSSYGPVPYNRLAAGNETNMALLEAIKAVARTDGIERVRLGSLEPRLLTEDFIKRLSEIDRLCPHFHISLQSGSDSVLARMNRHYTTADFEERVSLVRRYYEHPAITTDIIAGYPGETQEEFEETRAFLEKTGLYECHIFKYSRRKGTVADRDPDQLTDAVKSERSDILIAESDARKHEFMDYYIGKRVRVLTEDTEMVAGTLRTVGYTPEYVRVSLPQTAAGQIIETLCFERYCDIMTGGEHDTKPLS